MSARPDEVAGEAHRLIAEVHRLGDVDPAVYLEMAAVLAWAGSPAGPGAPPIVVAFLRFLTAGDVDAVLDLDEPDRTDALLLLADACTPAQALVVAAAIESAGAGPPLSTNLSAALALADAAAWQRFLSQVARTFDTAIHAGALVEGLVATRDSGGEPPESIADEWRRLQAGAGMAEVEVYNGRLRFAAREDAAAALPLLEEAVDQVGADAVALGVDAVLGRLAVSDEAAAAKFVRDARWRVDERAQLLRAAAWEAPQGFVADDVGSVAAELDSADLSPREAWTASFELIAAAARIGDSEAAARVVRTSGPPDWTVWNAAWPPLRKRGSGSAEFIDVVSAALAATPPGIAARGAPPAPPWARLSPDARRRYARIKALPIAGVPWWRPWGDGLP